MNDRVNYQANPLDHRSSGSSFATNLTVEDLVVMAAFQQTAHAGHAHTLPATPLTAPYIRLQAEKQGGERALWCAVLASSTAHVPACIARPWAETPRTDAITREIARLPMPGRLRLLRPQIRTRRTCRPALAAAVLDMIRRHRRQLFVPKLGCYRWHLLRASEGRADVSEKATPQQAPDAVRT